VVQALYSGKIHLGNDAEEILLLASAMQVIQNGGCAVLCCAVLFCAVLCCAVLCCAVLCCAVLCCCSYVVSPPG